MRRSLRTRVAVAAGAAAGWLSRVTGRGAGATVSGRVLNAIAPGALAELAAGRHTALVSATNGKTTTTRFLAAALATNGRTVTTNSTGANLTSGIAPTLARDRHADTAVLEVDERVLPKVVDVLGTELLVLGNLSRDQLDRYGEVHLVADAWRAVTEARPHLAVVANASDPHVVWAASPAAVTWVALGLGWRQDAATCPRAAAPSSRGMPSASSARRAASPSPTRTSSSTATPSSGTGTACRCTWRSPAAGTWRTPPSPSPPRPPTSTSRRPRPPARSAT